LNALATGGATSPTVASHSTTNGTYRIGGTSAGGCAIRVADPPADTPDPETPDPCVTVTVTEDPEDPTVQEQCPTTPPRVPHDSWGGRRLGHFPGESDTGEPDFDPESDLIFGARASYVGKNPDGIGYHNNHTDFGGILYDQIARFLGFHGDFLDKPTFFSPEDWPGGPGTQTELTAKNSPRLEVQYDAREVIASGLWENGAALVVRAGKMSLVKLDPMGSPSGVACCWSLTLSAATSVRSRSISASAALRRLAASDAARTREPSVTWAQVSLPPLLKQPQLYRGLLI
jgi:hypothetical protein